MTNMIANGASIWLKGVGLLVLLSAATASSAWAQTPEAASRIRESAQISGPTPWSVKAGATQATERVSDPLWNGALIGAGAAVTTGLLFCRASEPWRNCRDDYGPMLRIGAIGAGIGIAIDALIREKRTIGDAGRESTRVSATPLVDRRTRGLRVVFMF